MNRRNFATALLGGLCAPNLLLTQKAEAQEDSYQTLLGSQRKLTLKHARTDESFDAIYYENGTYLESEVNALDKLMRDYQVDEEIAMDVRLYDLLSALQSILNTPFYVTSAYRTEETNRKLRVEGRNSAQKSLHLYGMAADVYAERTSVTRLETAAVTLRQGGVGAYPSSGFVHLDVGRVRQWRR